MKILTSPAEQIECKQKYIEYLKQLTSGLEKEISELEQVDPYAELKAAHAAGKRLAVKAYRYGRPVYEPLANPARDAVVKDYKIVEDDEIDEIRVSSKFGYQVIKFTKCALTGKISAEVIE